MRQIFQMALCLLLLSSAARAQATGGLPDQVQREIVALVDEQVEKQGIPGLTVAVAVDNQLCFEQAFGLADVEHQVPTRPETLFRTASIAKPMTAAIVMRLADQGKLDLLEPVHQLCPGFPEKRWPVTSLQLLGHLGGVRHYNRSDEAVGTDYFETVVSALPLFANDPLLHEPGTKYKYTTFGYNLLGAVAENATGQDFMSLLRQHVTSPAGMRHTRLDSHFDIIPHRSRGYIRRPAGDGASLGQLTNARLHDTSMKVPGGGLLSTSADLVRFATAMNRGQLLSPTSLGQSWSKQVLANGTETDYGLGWSIRKLTDVKTVGHSGSQAGTATNMLLLPESGVCVAVMCNLQKAKIAKLTQAVASLVQAHTARQQSNRAAVDYSEVAEYLQAAIKAEVDQKALPAFSIALVDDQKIVWSEGFGSASLDGQVAASGGTVYRAGSVSKLLTDMAVMQQVEAGKLDLDVDIQQVLPDFRPENPFGAKITPRQLMSHLSGLVRESPVGNYFDPSEPSLKATVDSLSGTRLVYPPGTRTKYSNAGVAVVGRVLEQVTGKDFASHMRDQLLHPMGMRASDYQATAAVRQALAPGKMWTVDGRRFEAPVFGLGTSPAGNLYSTVADLSRLLSVIFAGGVMPSGERLLKPETLQMMMSPQTRADGKPSRFGIGFLLSQLDGHRAIGHGGAVYGFSTQLKGLPDSKIGVVAMSSLDGASGVVGRITDYALRLMLAAREGKPLPKFQQTLPVPEQTARVLAGRFESADGKVIEIEERGGRLFLHHDSKRQEVRWFDGELIVDDVHAFGLTVKVLSVDELQIGKSTYRRLADDRPADAPKRWQGLIGQYGWDHNTLFILENHGRLYALIEWFYYYPLTEISDDEFAFPDYGLYHGEKLRFERDAQGIGRTVVAAEVAFERRETGLRQGETFRIVPVRPVEELRPIALAASPPREEGQFLEPDLVDLAALEPSIQLDIRYATTNNFMGAVFYKQPRAFMQRPAASAVLAVHRRLKPLGYGLLIHDAYRPWPVTKMFWDATPKDLKDFVANPANGSRHNRGCAVDLTLFHLDSGEPVDMVAGYDEFSSRSFPAYPGGTSLQRWHRELLRREMRAAGFSIYEYEWWHFDFRDWKKYPILSKTFDEIDEERGAQAGSAKE